MTCIRQERTGWRCQAISERHREWGFNCPAVDLDFLMAEYNYGKPVALIEYKDRRARLPDIRHATYRALAALANGYAEGALPFIVAFYDPDAWWFRVIPVNQAAIEHYRHCMDDVLSEQRFVKSLYLMRKRTLNALDEKIIGGLNTTLPEQEGLRQ